MPRRIEEIFEECLKRVNLGESIESCLQSYPEFSEQLEILLRTSANIKWRSSKVTPRAEFKARARTQFIRAITEKNLSEHYRAMKKRYHKGPSVFIIHRILAPALTALIVIILIASAGTVTAAAATGAMPDEFLYPAKLATEQVRLAFSFTDADKAIVNAQIAETRAKEIQVMANHGNTEQVILATERMFINLENSQLAVSRVVQAQNNLLTPTPPAPTTTPLTEPPVEPSSTLPQVTPTPGAEPSPTPPADTKPEIPPTPQPETQDPAQNESGASERENNQKVEKLSKTAKLKKSLESAMDDNINQLELALASAPEEAKPYIQKAIEITKDKHSKIWADLPNGHHAADTEQNNEENSAEDEEDNEDTAGTSDSQSVNPQDTSDNNSAIDSNDKGNNGNQTSRKAGKDNGDSDEQHEED